MKIHWLQHVHFEGLGCIEPWLRDAGHEVSCTRFWAGDPLPDPSSIDGLIVMGGPMGIYDHDPYPWLVDEKRFLRSVLDRGTPVLGICLGAQLIADVLGARVFPGTQKEIGFYPLTGEGHGFPELFTAFHWHGDTFDLPDGALRLASSEVTENQAFLYRENVWALQFHLETTEESLLALYDNANDEIVDAPGIQTLEEMRPYFPTLTSANEQMFDLLNRLF